MPREQLLGLARDVDRLLAAGAPAAAGNEALRRRARTLRELGQKVAALNPIAEAVEKVVDSTGKQVAPAFLDLVRIVRQVRGNLATVGVEGELKPASPTGTWKTDYSIHEIHPLYLALVEGGPGREEMLRDAMNRNRLADLRLTSALLRAQDDGHAPIAELVTREAIPALGKAVLPDLERSINLQGKTLDARRLESICLIDKKVGLDYCRKALEEGSKHLKVKALECLPDVASAEEVEKVAMPLIEGKEAEVRAAAIGALRVTKSADAFEKVLEATRDRSEAVVTAAYNALAGLGYADTTPRLVAELNERLGNLTEIPKASKAKKATPAKGARGTKKPAKKDEETSEQEKARIARAKELKQAASLILALGRRKDKHRRMAAEAIVPLVDHKELEVSAPAVEALGTIGAATEQVLPTLIKAVEGKNQTLSARAVEAIAKIPPEHRAPAAEAIFEVIRAPKGDTWGKVRPAISCLPGFMKTHPEEVFALLKDQFKHKDRFRCEAAVTVCGEIGPPAKPLLSDIVDAIKKLSIGAGYAFYYYGWEKMAVLPKIEPEGKEAIPALTALLSNKKDVGLRTVALKLLGDYGAKARDVIPAIAPLTEENEYWVKSSAEEALRRIEGGE